MHFIWANIFSDLGHFIYTTALKRYVVYSQYTHTNDPYILPARAVNIYGLGAGANKGGGINFSASRLEGEKIQCTDI